MRINKSKRITFNSMKTDVIVPFCFWHKAGTSILVHCRWGIRVGTWDMELIYTITLKIKIIENLYKFSFTLNYLE